MREITNFYYTTGFAYLGIQNVIMITIAMGIIYLAIVKKYEPLLLLPIGFGMTLGNLPGIAEMMLGIYDEGTTLNTLYMGVLRGIYPPLIFLGVGAMTDFSSLIANPRLVFLGFAAQFGIFATFMGALWMGFSLPDAASIGIIGSSDGPTVIFLASRLSPHLLGTLALAAYSYMAVVPIIQPPVIRLLTTDKERIIRMKTPRLVSKREKILFPIIAFIATSLIAPAGSILLGMLFFGNLLRESGVVERLANTAKSSLIDICTIIIGICIGATTQGSVFLQLQTLMIIGMGAFSFMMATGAGVLGAKCMNLFLKEKINPIIGAAGLSVMPGAARVVQKVGQEYDKNNFLLMHAMAPNVAGVIGSAVVAGVFLGILG